MKSPHRLLTPVLALLLIGYPLLAQTTIADTIKDASGHPVPSGSITFTPTMSFESATNASWVSRSPVSARISSGVFTVTLEPTTAVGACYAVSFLPASISPRQMAGVPVTSSTLNLQSIINANGCTQPSSWLAPPPPTGTYCVQAVNGVYVGTWGACGSGSGGGGSGALSWSHLTNAEWTGMTNAQWTGMTN